MTPLSMLRYKLRFSILLFPNRERKDSLRLLGTFLIVKNIYFLSFFFTAFLPQHLKEMFSRKNHRTEHKSHFDSISTQDQICYFRKVVGGSLSFLFLTTYMVHFCGCQCCPTLCFSVLILHWKINIVGNIPAFFSYNGATAKPKNGSIEESCNCLCDKQEEWYTLP